MLLIKTKQYSKKNNNFYLKKLLFLNIKFKKFKFYKKGISNLNINKNKLIKYRKKKYKLKSYKINLNKNFYTKSFLVIKFIWYFKKQKPLSYLKSNNGISFLKINNNYDKLFSYNFNFKYNFFLKKNTISSKRYLGFIKPLSLVSELELFYKDGSKYTKANGSKSKIIFNNTKKLVSLVQLPSKESKYFSLFSVCNPSSCSFSKFKILKKNNKIFKYLKGFKCKVRGIAKNPVDHPHGGNTKSIKYPRTPWGLTTKFK